MKTIFILVFLIFEIFTYSQADKITIDYFGQPPPDTIPEILLPE